MHAAKMIVDVPADHKIVIDLPADFPAGIAEVIVLAHSKSVSEDGMTRLERVQAHPWLGKIQINYDPTESLSEDEWPMDQR